jgi:hypothetical protein
LLLKVEGSLQVAGSSYGRAFWPLCRRAFPHRFWPDVALFPFWRCRADVPFPSPRRTSESLFGKLPQTQQRQLLHAYAGCPIPRSALTLSSGAWVPGRGDPVQTSLMGCGEPAEPLPCCAPPGEVEILLCCLQDLSPNTASGHILKKEKPTFSVLHFLWMSVGMMSWSMATEQHGSHNMAPAQPSLHGRLLLCLWLWDLDQPH